MKRLFGTFGVRRTANDVLTPEFASRLAASYGSIVQGKVAIGGDTRTTTPMIKHAIAAGLLSSGCDVIDLGILPTPAVQYAVRNYYDGGIIVTASHNPPKYNGLKFVDEYGIGLKDEDELAIEEMYFDDEPKRNTWDSIGNYYKNDTIIEEYIEEILKRIDVDSIQKAKLKVVLDCGSGAGCFTSPYLMQKLGCELITLNSQADGFFPGRNPEPTEPNLKELIATVKDLKADIGIAHDGDADRTICIDEKGNFVLGDKTFSLVEKQMLKDSKEENKEEKLENKEEKLENREEKLENREEKLENREEKKENKKEKLENKEVKLNNKNKNSKNLIVTTVATSQAIYDIAKEYGGEVIATAVGDLLVARKLMEEDGLFGGEE
ncbi:MAG: hypothetical protein FWE58_01825, partial [Methanobrevibacter sp.]|nr:hypothetical protein [Methanobrevibacter sp.]